MMGIEGKAAGLRMADGFAVLALGFPQQLRQLGDVHEFTVTKVTGQCRELS